MLCRRSAIFVKDIVAASPAYRKYSFIIFTPFGIYPAPSEKIVLFRVKLNARP